MRFKTQWVNNNKIEVSCFTKEKIEYSEIYEEFNSNFKEYSKYRKVCFTQTFVKAKYGKCYLNIFYVLTNKI